MLYYPVIQKLKKKLPPIVVKLTMLPAVELLLKINKPATND